MSTTTKPLIFDISLTITCDSVHGKFVLISLEKPSTRPLPGPIVKSKANLRIWGKLSTQFQINIWVKLMYSFSCTAICFKLNILVELGCGLTSALLRISSLSRAGHPYISQSQTFLYQAYWEAGVGGNKAEMTYLLPGSFLCSQELIINSWRRIEPSHCFNRQPCYPHLSCLNVYAYLHPAKCNWTANLHLPNKR